MILMIGFAWSLLHDRFWRSLLHDRFWWSVLHDRFWWSVLHDRFWWSILYDRFCMIAFDDRFCMIGFDDRFQCMIAFAWSLLTIAFAWSKAIVQKRSCLLLRTIVAIVAVFVDHDRFLHAFVIHVVVIVSYHGRRMHSLVPTLESIHTLDYNTRYLGTYLY